MSSWSVRASAIWSLAVVAFLALPIVAVVLMSLSPSRIIQFPPSGLSLRWYSEAIASPLWQTSARNSLIVALGAMAVATPIGTIMAIVVRQLGGSWRSIASSLIITPMIVPVVVMGLAMFFTMANIGILGTKLGLVIAHSIIVLPLVFIAISAALEYFDDNLIEAAQSLGATQIYAWRTVLLPFVMPAVIIGGILSFINSMDEAVVAIFLGRGTAVTIPNLIWRQLNVELSPDVAAVAVLIAIFCLLLQAGVSLLLVKYISRLRRQ